MAVKIIVARRFDEACAYAKSHNLIGINDWVFISACGDNLHKLQGRAPRKKDVIMLATPDFDVDMMLRERIAVGEAMAKPPPRLPTVTTIPDKDLEQWASQLRVVESALFDLGYKGMSAEVGLIVSKLRGKFIP